MRNNKLTTSIKKWYRGKQAPPLEVMLANKIIKLPSEEYIQPLVVRLFKKIISSSPQTTKQWYEKPFGIVLLMVFGGLIVGYLIYYLGWN
jgi:hypothetical protein